jgi:hypothetical protein
MWVGTRNAIALSLVAVLALGPAACGGNGDDTTATTAPPPPVSAATADRLAKLSDRIATNLGAGLTCDAAYAADEFKAAVEEADLSASLRPGVEEVATRLVNEVNCPPPPPPPEPEEKKKDEQKKDEEKKQEGDEGDGDKSGPGSDGSGSESGGFVPPGQAKLKGEEG